MNPIIIQVQIPALDRLCGLIEAGKVPQPAPMIRMHQEPAPKAAPAPVQPAPEPPREAPAPVPEPAPEPAQAVTEPPKAPAATLDAVQRAAAQLRDEGKLKAVTDMFPEFGIKKLSDLAGDALQAFAGRLREMGAAL